MENSNLSINIEVLEEMAALAANEVDGVFKASNKAVDFKNVLNTGKLFKPAVVKEVGGLYEIELYICIEEGVNVKTVADEVQKAVKEKVQNMTGNAVTKVDVNICDVHFKEEQ